ncbi:hypothetical protein EVAR_63355_1 [Eumeta japonica]|uniref:Uncharacterized protein n=1 Tax=Eumeta variegata TaxID=151549 RepID=A0A4C2AB98_EUMVA|nr:hypothetical protein EVAR_63355_1 [Eumeta japonica]
MRAHRNRFDSLKQTDTHAHCPHTASKHRRVYISESGLKRGSSGDLRSILALQKSQFPKSGRRAIAGLAICAFARFYMDHKQLPPRAPRVPPRPGGWRYLRIEIKCQFIHKRPF